MLCWRNGQRSPIHNHRGSNCGVKVLRASPPRRCSRGRPTAWSSPPARATCRAGHLCPSADDDIHQVSNLQAGGADLVTLHVYSPPLLRMDAFSLDNPAVREWDDPVNTPFAFGGGI